MLVACKPATPEVNITMRRCLFFYHTDLRKNAVFHNFAKQIALIPNIQDDIARASFTLQFIELTTL